MKMKTNIDEYVIQVISNEQGLPNIDFEMKYKVKKDKSFYYYFFVIVQHTFVHNWAENLQKYHCKEREQEDQSMMILSAAPDTWSPFVVVVFSIAKRNFIFLQTRTWSKTITITTTTTIL